MGALFLFTWKICTLFFLDPEPDARSTSTSKCKFLSQHISIKTNCLIFLCMLFLTKMNWYLVLFLVIISQVINVDKQLFDMLIIHLRSSLGNCLFLSSPYLGVVIVVRLRGTDGFFLLCSIITPISVQWTRGGSGIPIEFDHMKGFSLCNLFPFLARLLYFLFAKLWVLYKSWI